MNKLLTALLCTVAFSSSAATLTTSDNLRITAINGEAVKHGLVELESGTHFVELSYREVFQGQDQESHRFVSQNQLFTSIEIGDGSYEIKADNHSTIKEAKDFLNKPSMNLFLNGKDVGELPVLNMSMMIHDLSSTK